MVSTVTEEELASGYHTEFSTGLIAEYDFTVASSIFTKDARYNKGESLLLSWSGPTNLEEPNDERNVFITIGNGWVTNDGGRTIEREDPSQDKKFNASTKMAFLIDRVINDFQMVPVLKPRGPLFQADIWEGCKFHMTRQTLDPSNENAKPTEFPSAFLGMSGAASASAPATNGNAAPATSVRDQVVALFQASTDFGAAQAAALGIPGVSTDAALLQEVLNPEGLWKQVKG